MELSTVTMKIHLSELLVQYLNLKTILINSFNIFNSLPSKAPFRGENVVTFFNVTNLFACVHGTAKFNLKNIIKKALEVTVNSLWVDFQSRVIFTRARA